MARPSRHNKWILEIPESTKRTMTAWYEKPHQIFDEYYVPFMVYLNPYHGRKLYQISLGEYICLMDIRKTHSTASEQIRYCSSNRYHRFRFDNFILDWIDFKLEEFF